MKFSIVFPGQGSQQLGMLGDLNAKYPIISETFHEASEQLGYDLWKLTQEGPEEKLNLTEFTQPALLASSVALWRVWQSLTDDLPIYLAGHSLGEYSALVCADALDFCDAIELVSARGRFMQAAIPEGQGAMAAIVGLSPEAITNLCQQVSGDNEKASPANYNSSEQIVIAGHTPAIERAISEAKRQGAKIAIKLPMSVPSHTVLMKPAAMKMEEKLQSITIKQPILPVLNNVDVACYQQPNQIADALVRQLYNPVRWLEIIQLIAIQPSMQVIIECGPGRILSGLNERIAPTVKSVSLSQPDGFHEAFSIKEIKTCS